MLSEEGGRPKRFELLSCIFGKQNDEDETTSPVNHQNIQKRFQDAYSITDEKRKSNDDSIRFSTASGESNPQRVPQRARRVPSNSSISPPSVTRINKNVSNSSVPVGICFAAGKQNINRMTSSPPTMTQSLGGQSASPIHMRSLCGSPIVLHQTPLKTRDIGVDMEAIRLSRQDNPFLQRVAGSQGSLIDEGYIDGSGGAHSHDEEDRTILVAQNRSSQDSILSISEVHEHLIRSPPPLAVPKTLDGKGFFVFPMMPFSSDEETDDKMEIPWRSKSLNPLLSHSKESVTEEQSLRNLIRQNSKPRTTTSVSTNNASLSCSVPGSPARLTTSSVSSRRITKPKTHTVENRFGYVLSSTHGSSANTSTIRDYDFDSVFVTDERFSPPAVGNSKSSTKMRKTKRSFSSNEAEILGNKSRSSFSSMFLPIKCPHQPANPKVL